MYETNCKIRYTKFGIEDHGILTFTIGLDGNGWGQNYGGFGLDTYDNENEDVRRGFGPGLTAIRKILETVGVKNWENLPGTLCRIRREKEFDNDIQAIGHIIDNQWFNLRAFMKEESEKISLTKAGQGV